MDAEPPIFERGDIVYLRDQLAIKGGKFRVLVVRSDWIKLQQGSKDAIQLSHQRLYELMIPPQEYGYEEGVLSAVGYHVGKEGMSLDRRRRLLKALIAKPMERLPQVPGVEEWDEAESAGRIVKLGRCLSTFAQNASNRSNPPQDAIDGWLSDLEWLKEEFGGDLQGYWAPTTSD